MKRAIVGSEQTERKGILMCHRYFISLIVIVICGFSPYGAADIFAQNLESRDTVQWNKYNLSQFWHETVGFFVQPTKWDGGDWLRIGVIGGATFLTMQADQPIRDAVLRDNRRYFYSVPIEGARMYGELYSPVVFFVGFAAHSLITNDKSTRKIAYEIGQASLYTGAITYIIKTAFGRARPYMNEGSSSFHPFTFRDDYHSFSGGHTATAFVLSTILSRNAGPTWLKILAYLPATITPISRIYEDKHWVSSNFFGGLLGYFVATWVVDTHEKKDKQVQSTSSTPLLNISIVVY
jgi:membrane-associated phospholipid phosphatase